jgi:DNA-binding NtrC family response regulator
VVTKAAVLTRGSEIQAADLVLGQPKSQILSAPVATFSTSANSANLEGIEKSMILRVLSQTNGHQQRAADLLGISRRTLSRKLKLYGKEAVRESCAS